MRHAMRTLCLNTEDASANRSLVRSNGSKESSRGLRFVQLYTSKSYENRRGELVNPPSEESDEGNNSAAESNESHLSESSRSNSTADNLQKHVLSPRLVDAIAKTTQVVWANSKRREGLIGRSDIRLQTAVGMPVAMDDMGNMCVVVMFSPNNIQSTDDAIDYLQSISRSAMTSTIPCMFPVFDTTNLGMQRNQLTYLGLQHHHDVHGDRNDLGEGVTARFVSFEDHHLSDDDESAHELSHAPKDTFGIPMLPTFAELGNIIPDDDNIDVFDEASYGIWTTIMDTLVNDADLEGYTDDSMDFSFEPADSLGSTATESLADVKVALPGDAMPECRKTRLEEFCTAFLDMSVFDLADVWVPAGSDYPDCLRHVTSVTSTDRNMMLDEFQLGSSTTLIGIWQGAVGRAYSSGNPVWSANRNVFVDPGRSALFRSSKIMTVLAVPVFSGKSTIPACVVACYSLVRSGSVPFVLRFVQQALRLLWDGLDTLVEPHDSVGRTLWQDVAPADLGEMAADVEMQHHFMKKKRPHSVISDGSEGRAPADPSATELGESVHVPFELPPESKEASVMTDAQTMNLAEIHHHFHDAIRTAQEAIPFTHATPNLERSNPAIVYPVRPLPMPLSFPTTILSSDSSLVENEAERQPRAEPFSLNAAVFVFPQQPVFGNQQQPDKRAPLQMEESAPVDAMSVAESPNVDSKIYCISVNGGNGACVVPPEMLSFSNKQCRIVGCEEVSGARRPYCVLHSGNRICEFDGCTKCAQGSTRFCIAHGGGRRCTFPGCDKGARDKFYCAAHGGGKRCRSYACNKSAVGGSTFCTAHGGGKRCDVEGCDKSAQSSTRFCVKHGGGKKCSHEGCEKVARGRTNFCAAHGGGVRCKLDGCNRVAIGKLQLCRAHGGGARLKRTTTAHRVVQPTSPPQAGPSFMMVMDRVA
jgi:hypothetical protein